MGNINEKITINAFVSIIFLCMPANLEPLSYPLLYQMTANMPLPCMMTKKIVIFPKGGQLVLWDIVNRKKIILSENANVFSAAFVPGSHDFMWQDDNDIVHIQDVNGKEKLQFRHITTFGHIIDASKKFYVSSDIGWHLFKRAWGKYRKN